MKLAALLKVPIDPAGDPVYSVDGELLNFTVDLFSCIKLGFPALIFTAGSGKSPDVDVDLKWVAFGGPLTFVESLREFISGLGGDIFSIDIEPSGVRATLSIPVPTIAVGIFSLQNIRVGAQLDLPFVGDKPTLLRFNFCEREAPFILTVGPFGGGGFVAITLGLSGVQMLEAALEFGASIAINLGVASGGVSVMAGIYFKYEDGKGATLEGYLKLQGSLEVLGIITVSVKFYLSFTYQEQGNKVWGQATLTVEIEILFFSASVSMTVERQFSGNENDPPFSVLVDEPAWEAYTDAFAA